jgi:hypothetical protein
VTVSSSTSVGVVVGVDVGEVTGVLVAVGVLVGELVGLDVLVRVGVTSTPTWTTAASQEPSGKTNPSALTKSPIDGVPPDSLVSELIRMTKPWTSQV